MNTYNENLHNTVLASLQNQALEQKTLMSQYNASTFTLYYTEGATITAYEKLEAAQTDLTTSKTPVKEQAVKNTNISNNLLSSATQANQYLGQSVSDTAVCASNVQIAANAVTRLASDVGGIFSIINAADFDTDIYNLTDTVRELINNTAYAAELASQIAMDASTLTAEVSASTVLANAKATSGYMNNLLKITSADFDAATQLVGTDNAVLSAANSKEKLAEGALEAVTVDYNAAQDAYNFINKDLNLNLTATAVSSTTFDVQFDPLKAPFASDKSAKPGYPVSEYYIIVVKESKQLTFTISNAENLLLKGNNQFVVVPGAPAASEDDTASASLRWRVIKQEINFLIDGTDAESLNDSDGDAIQQGVNYVVFVLAVYMVDEYKRVINNFDDFLSAPSQPFCLTNQLVAVENDAIEIEPVKHGKKSEAETHDETEFKNELSRIGVTLSGSDNSEGKSDFNYKLTFTVTEDPEFRVSYRCMLLPFTDKSEDLLTEGTLQSFLDEEKALERIANEFDPKIAELETQLTGINQELLQATSDAEKTKVRSLNKQQTELEKALKQLIERRNKEMRNLTVHKQSKPGFIFNLALAEQVPAGNYIPAVKPSTHHRKHKEEGKNPNAKLAHDWVAYIGPATTDNFGNMLVDGTTYIPVVLSAAAAEEENLSQFTNAISDFAHGQKFTYNEQPITEQES